MTLFNLSRLPCPVIPVKAPIPGTFDCYVLVCENLEWSNPGWDFLKTPILEAAKVKATCIIYYTSIIKLLETLSESYPVQGL